MFIIRYLYQIPMVICEFQLIGPDMPALATGEGAAYGVARPAAEARGDARPTGNGAHGVTRPAGKAAIRSWRGRRIWPWPRSTCRNPPEYPRTCGRWPCWNGRCRKA